MVEEVAEVVVVGRYVEVAGHSPRADTTTPLREASASGSAVNDVIVSSSTVFPASVSQSGRRRKRLRVFGSSSSPLRYAPRSDIVYGWQ